MRQRVAACGGRTFAIEVRCMGGVWSPPLVMEPMSRNLIRDVVAQGVRSAFIEM